MNYAKVTHKYTLEIDGQQFYLIATTDGDIPHGRYQYLSNELRKKLKKAGAHEMVHN